MVILAVAGESDCKSRISHFLHQQQKSCCDVVVVVNIHRHPTSRNTCVTI